MENGTGSTAHGMYARNRELEIILSYRHLLIITSPWSGVAITR